MFIYCIKKTNKHKDNDSTNSNSILFNLKQQIMKIQETTEYRMVKMITAQKNRKAVLNALWKVPLSMACMYAGMYGFMYFLLWLWQI